MKAETEYSWEILCIVTGKNADCKFELVVVPQLHRAKPARLMQ